MRRFHIGGVSLVALGVGLGVALTPLSADAQQSQGQQQSQDAKGASYDPVGGRLGSFILYPKVEVIETYNSNIFLSNANDKSDFITQITPRLNLLSDWNQHSLSLDGGANFGIYADSSADDYTDYDAALQGRLDASRALTINLNGGLSHGHEDRGGDDVGSDAAGPVETDQLTGVIEGKYKPNRLSLTVAAEVNDYNIDDNKTISGGTTNNDDRDRLDYELRGRLGYEIQEGYEGFVRASYNDRNYDDGVDDAGVNRDSDGYRIEAGVAIELTRLLTGDVGVGWASQNYTDATLKDVGVFSANGNLRWSVTPLTALRFSISTGVNETTTGAVSSTLATGTGIGLDHEFLRNLTAKADINYVNSEYQGDPAKREDNTLTFSAGMDYKLNRNLFAGLEYTYDYRDSNINANSYIQNTFLVKVGAQF